MQKNKPPFVLVSGKSGSGKTTLIKNLYDYGFRCPSSYTTRKKRYDTENDYIFISPSEILELYDKGELVNLDICYNNFYGIQKKSLNEIIEDNLIPIKEIHPSNLEKISSSYECITVLISKKDIDDRGRAEDKLFYESLEKEAFDIVIENDGSVEEMIDIFLLSFYNITQHINH